MKTKDFTYKLPEKLIAQTPLKNRLDSKLLVLNKHQGSVVHETFSALDTYLKKGDVLVLNDTEVIPARLIGTKLDTGATIEVLLLNDQGDNIWECLVKKAKKIKVGTRVSFGDDDLMMECIATFNEGIRHFKLTYKGILYEVLDSLGEMPLPPYIHEKLEEKSRYQTVYSKHKGSAAAPTAGLHFTQAYLKHLAQSGIEIAYVTLHVGLGTFRPVKVDDVKNHKMHEEYYSITPKTASIINQALDDKRRIIAVGTTSLRTLESSVSNAGHVIPRSGLSDLFIYPGFDFKIISGLITNFHLPESTLLMLVSALAGKANILNAYKEAVKKEYRFFSFGDAMFITP